MTPDPRVHGGARGQKLGHYFSVTETTYADSWSDMAQLVGHEMKVSMTYISWSSDCALYLEDFFMYEHHYLGDNETV